MSLAGVLSRILGFLYKIFLSRQIGAENLGLYHLIFPIFTLILMLCGSGFQTTLSRYIAKYRQQPKTARRFFYFSLFCASSLALLCSFLLYFYANTLSIYVLNDIRTAELLRICSFSFLPAVIHSCINGYYYGLKQTFVPSLSQLTEQICRFIGVFCIGCVLYALEHPDISLCPSNFFSLRIDFPLHASHAVWGLVISEYGGMLISIILMMFGIFQKQNERTSSRLDAPLYSWKTTTVLTLSMTIPLTLNRLISNICTSIEHMMIPKQLCAFGLTTSESLSVFGILSGMALPILFFPTVVTGSISVLLLPTISEATATHQTKVIQSSIAKVIQYGFLIGLTFTFFLLVFGEMIGTVVFASPLAGLFIKKMSFSTSFLYISGMLSSILHGLGRSRTVLYIQILSCGIRLFFVWKLIPLCGISAYLWSILLSSIFCFFASYLSLKDIIKN